jgi:hypothetical protein
LWLNDKLIVDRGVVCLTGLVNSRRKTIRSNNNKNKNEEEVKKKKRNAD